MARNVWCENGLLRILGGLRISYLPTWQVGLFQNDYIPVQNSTLAHITPANFSGYSGLQPPVNWTVPAIEGARGVSRADRLTWIHNGGATNNWVYGFYVIDAGGGLIFAQRFADAPKLLASGGVLVYVDPLFSIRSEF